MGPLVNEKRIEFALSVAGATAFVGIWWLLAASPLTNPLLLPTPLAVVFALVRFLREPFANATLGQHLIASVGRFALGFSLAAIVAIPLGLAMGASRRLDDVVSPFFEAIRYVAPISWLPFAVLWFGTGIGGPIMIIFAGVFPTCLVNAYRGARFADPQLLEAASTLGAGSQHVLLDVLVPAALPSIVAGLRIGAGAGWQSLIGAELIIVSSGVGYAMVQAQSSLETPIVMTTMLAIGLIGATIDVALRGLERNVARWTPG
ncbi:MAG: ABC transporter permease [Candidatus Eremiobacteraeota bacterium]|nr:ABC transporter permease [Candidatus Eremiobacteraeota bacterium]